MQQINITFFLFVSVLAFAWTGSLARCQDESAAFDLAAALASAQAGDTIRVPSGIHYGQFKITIPLALMAQTPSRRVKPAAASTRTMTHLAGEK